MVKTPKPTTIDFETFGILDRPAYPPIPVGVSIKKWGKRPRYYAWGHAEDNNCTRDEALAALREVWNTPEGLLFHNAKFDVDVAETHLGLPLPAWDRVHDTVFLLFLDNPHAFDLGLKPSAKRLLGMEPEERDAVADWLVLNQPVPGVRVSKGAKGKEPPGKYIAYAPGHSIVGPYANGDVVRTEELFRHLCQSVCVDRQMQVAYDRERRLLPIFLAMERQGVRVDLERLRRDVGVYQTWRTKIRTWLGKRLKISDEVNLDSGAQLLGALREADVVDESLMGRTKPSKTFPEGQTKTDKAALTAGVTDKVLGAVLRYDTQLQTCLSTFMENWLRIAEQSGGLIFTTWNQTRGEGGGTRTGRLSSSKPTNFQNIPKEFGVIFYHEAIAWNLANPTDKIDPRNFPRCPWKDLPALPLCRGYIVPYAKNHVLAGRDYSQQEPRILAHFEDGVLKDQYLANPYIDYHDNAKEHLERLFHRPFKRKPVKNINLGIIYGQGIGSLAEKNGESYEDTKSLKDAIYAMYPGLRDMYDDMRDRARMNEPIRTWGGREYYCEPPMIIDGRIRTFDYKMVNVLVQGSAADCTKEALIRFWNRYHNRSWVILLQVHDELVLSVPANELVEAQEALRECMESVEFDVLILSEGAWSQDNWASMRDFDKKGQRVIMHEIPKQRRAA